PQEARPDVVRMGTPGRPTFAFHGSEHQLLSVQGSAKEFVHRERSAGAARAGAAEATCKRHLLVQVQTDTPAGNPLLAGATQHIRSGPPNDVLHRIAAQPPALPGNRRYLDTR